MLTPQAGTTPLQWYCSPHGQRGHGLCIGLDSPPRLRECSPARRYRIRVCRVAGPVSPIRLPKLAGIQRRAAHVIRRYRAVAGLGPGSLQSWAADVIEILRDTHRLTEEAGPGANPPPMRNRWPGSASATTRPSPRASPATGTGTGMTVTTPAALSAAGCATTRPGLAVHPRTLSRVGDRRLRAGTPRRHSPGGAASAATSTPPPPTASPPSGRHRRPGRQALATRPRRGLSSHP